MDLHSAITVSTNFITCRKCINTGKNWGILCKKKEKAKQATF